MVLTKLLTRRWWLPTLLVLAGMALLIWLGFWQLRRMDQRTAYNDLVIGRWVAAPLELNPTELPSDLGEWEYRRLALHGQFDFAHQIVLKNQFFAEQPGVQLVTPLLLGNTADGAPKAVLVARGWVPFEDAKPENVAQFDEPNLTQIVGLVQESQMMPGGEAPTVPDAPQSEWFRINIDAIQPQMPYELLPFFIYALPEEGRTINDLPIREPRDPAYELRSPIMHLSYAVQWFSFAMILGFGYTQLVRVQERRRLRQESEPEIEVPDVEAPDVDAGIPSTIS
ncbi:MAG: SURF1 family protein [Caldilineaceae bacterium]